MRKVKFNVKSFIWLIILAQAFVISGYSKELDWLAKMKKVELFKTMDTEVEKLFPRSKIIKQENLSEKFKYGWGKTVEYKTDSGRLEIDYSTGKCSESKSKYGFNIDKNIIVGMMFSPEEEVSVDALGYNPQKFKKTVNSQFPLTYNLSDDKLGVSISVFQGKVDHINFYISEKKQKFACRNTPTIKETEWLVKLRQIEPLKATRSDVERIFYNAKIVDIYDTSKKEKGGWGIEIKYKTKYGELEVEYSTGNCKETQSKYGYDLEKNVISEISFTPKESVDATATNFNFKQFDSEKVEDVQSLYIHTNRKLGMRMSLLDGKITDITFDLKEKDFQRLNCEKILNIQ